MLNFLNYIIWNVSPEIFAIGWLSIRWYGLLFASGFLIGQWIFTKIFKWEGKPEKDLEVLLIYMVLATVVGARLGHCFFYEPAHFLANPIEILYVWKGGLASHGAAIGILLALYLYSRKRVGQSFFWVTDRIVIVVALGGALIRLGNLFNSEIVGKPTDASYAFVFADKWLEEHLKDNKKAVLSSTFEKRAAPDTVVKGITYTPVKIIVKFDSREINAQDAHFWMTESIPYFLENGSEIKTHAKLLNPNPKYVVQNADREIIVSVNAYGIPRHPAQLYEAVSSFLLFIFLFAIYYRWKEKTPEGFLFALFMIILFSLRFVYEFLKENQVAFEDTMSYNMGQILSIPGVLIGFIALFFALRYSKKG
jgi:prolipoprotein diacylglyceryl transferase